MIAIDWCYQYHTVKYAADGTDLNDPLRMGAKSTLLAIIPVPLAKPSDLNFHPLEGVSHCRMPENYS